MKITLHDEYDGDVTIEMGEKYGSEMYRVGGMICNVSPWGSSGCPITLEMCICPDGEILVRSWEWSGGTNHYLQTLSKPEEVMVTPQMKDTVSGLFSGRIKIDGIKIAVGKTVQDICPIDLETEEKRVGHQIYLASVWHK